MTSIPFFIGLWLVMALLLTAVGAIGDVYATMKYFDISLGELAARCSRLESRLSISLVRRVRKEEGVSASEAEEALRPGTAGTVLRLLAGYFLALLIASWLSGEPMLVAAMRLAEEESE